MLQIERIHQILEYINNNNRANVAELCKVFGVSPVTIRRDIDTLAQEGLVIKTHGGVFSAQNKLSYEIPYSKKMSTNLDKKKQIGIEAAKMIKDNDIVILDAGTTTLQVAKHIKRRNVTVITNDLYIAQEVASKHNLDLIVVGGRLERGVYTLTGPNAVTFLKKLHANKVFLGVDAMDIEFGVSNRTVSEVDVKLAMKNAADEVIAVTDSSKFHRKLFYSLFPVEEIDTLITDKADQALLEYFSKYGKKVIETDKKTNKGIGEATINI